MEILIYKGQSVINSVMAEDDSYIQHKLMDVSSVFLHYKSTDFDNSISAGCYIVIDNVKYYLYQNPIIEKNGTRDFNVTCYFYSVSYSLKNILFKDCAAIGRSDQKATPKFSLTGNLKDFAEFIIANMNRYENGWSLGIIDKTEEHSMSFDGVNCYDALRSICEEFDVEYDISEDKVLSLEANFQRNRLSSPPVFSYGMDNALLAGIGRTNIQEGCNITRIYINGSDRNIIESEYGNKTLLLPKNKTLYLDGKMYKSSRDGMYIERADVSYAPFLTKEDYLDCSSIYPKRIGVVSQWITINEEQNLYDFTDETIPDTLNYKEQMIEGETMSVIFQTGMLAGKSFDVNYYHDNQMYNKKRYFELVPKEIDGYKMPSNVFKAQTGDKYIVVGISLPNTYICDNRTQKGASWEMFKYAAAYMSDREDDRFEFSGKLNKLWLQRNDTINNLLSVGDTCYFWDPQFQKKKVKSRVNSRKINLNDNYNQEIVINNSAQTRSKLRRKLERIPNGNSGFSNFHFEDNIISRIGNQINSIDGLVNDGAIQEFDTISNEQLQFNYTDENWQNVIDVCENFAFDDDGGFYFFPEGHVRHETIGYNHILSTQQVLNLRYRCIVGEDIAYLDFREKYFLYIKTPKEYNAHDSHTGLDFSNAQYVISQTKILLEQEQNYYHFCVGVFYPTGTGHRFSYRCGCQPINSSLIPIDKISYEDGRTAIDIKRGKLQGDYSNNDINGGVNITTQSVNIAGNSMICLENKEHRTEISSNSVEVGYGDYNNEGVKNLSFRIEEGGNISVDLVSKDAGGIVAIVDGLPVIENKEQMDELKNGQLYIEDNKICVNRAI